MIGKNGPMKRGTDAKGLLVYRLENVCRKDAGIKLVESRDRCRAIARLLVADEVVQE